MPITVECPHCEEQFQLAPEMAGRTIGCPACRGAFAVPGTDAAATPVTAVIAVAPDLPYERLEVDAVSIPVAEPESPAVPLPAPPAATPARASTPVAKPLPTAKPLPRPAPRELDWRDDSPVGEAPPLPVIVDDEEDPAAEFVRRRPPRRSRSKARLGALAAGFVLLSLAGGGLYWRSGVLRESVAAEIALASYSESNYPVARDQFGELVAQFPDSSERGRYEFFASLAGLQVAAGAPTINDDPAAARGAFAEFVRDRGADPLARPGEGFGADIFSAGRRVADAGGEFAAAALARFRANRADEPALARAEAAVEEARAFALAVEPMRVTGGGDLADLTKRLDELRAGARQERHRLAVLAPFRNLAADPTAQSIAAFEATLARESLGGDAEARSLVGAAEKRLRELIRYAELNRAAPAAPDVPPPVLFTSVLPARPGEILYPFPAASRPGPVAFDATRGVLSAYDARTGEPLWGCRFAAPTAARSAADLPVPLELGESPAVLVAGELAGSPALTARRARTGEVLWSQPLPAAAVGRPVTLGGRVYLALNDPRGTVLEFELLGGTLLGRLEIRQPVGAGVAALPAGRGGVGLLAVAGDTKRVFLFELGRESAKGVPLAPRLARVLVTGHPLDSLRCAPLVAGARPGGDGERYLILAQAAGPATMRLRAVPVPPFDQVVADARAGPAESNDPAAELPVPGWASFEPSTDGERVALATDAGAVALFGVGQTAGGDAPLFAVPGPAAEPPADPSDLARSQIVVAGEDRVWAVAGGRLSRHRVAVDPGFGLRLLPAESGVPVGDPSQRAQTYPELALAVVGTRTDSGAQLTAVDLASGRVRWRRRVGVTPAGAPFALAGGAAVAGTDGAVYRVTVADSGASVEVIAPPRDLVAPAEVAPDLSGGTGGAVVAVAETPEGRAARVQFVSAAGVTEATAPLPDAPRGPPLFHDGAVHLPLANGLVYRLAPGASQWQAGPLWRGESAGDDARCMLGVATGGLLVPDGVRAIYRWDWPPSAEPARHTGPAGGPWELPAKLALPPLALPNGELIAADARGVLSHFKAGSLARRFTPGEDGFPAGSPTGRLARLPGEPPRVVYVTDQQRFVALDLGATTPAWVAELPPVAGWSVDGDAVRVTLSSGAVRALDGRTGKPSADTHPTAVPPSAEAVAVGPGRVLVLTADGAGDLAGR